MSRFRKFVASFGVAILVAGCSHSSTVKRLGVDYNRAMADARDEQLLANIVRASGREPLMFSAIGEVSASVNRKGSLETAFTKLITGGNDEITPTLGLEASISPVVKVAPLSSKEFTEGILRPIKPDVLNFFISQGWDTEFLLPLVLAGYTCPGRDEYHLYPIPEGVADVTSLAASLSSFSLRQESENKPDITLPVSSAEALEMMRTGVASGYKVKSVHPALDPRGREIPGRSVVTLGSPESKTWKANPPLPNGACGSAKAENYRVDEGGKSTFVLRSVEGIIYYLGAAFRPCLLGQKAVCKITYDKPVEDQATVDCLKANGGGSVTLNAKHPRILFKLNSSQRPPTAAAISTKHNGVHYWVSPLDRCDMDRSLKTLSFLSQLIALQTNATDLAVTPSVIAVNP